MNTYQKIMTGIATSVMLVGCGNVKAEQDNRPYHQIIMERHPDLTCYDGSRGYSFKPFDGISEKLKPGQNLDQFLSTYKVPVVQTFIEKDQKRRGEPRTAVCTEKSNPAKITFKK